jgi:hypothetical protein
VKQTDAVSRPRRSVERIRSVAHRLLLVLSAGYILMFFSEHMFWARFRPGTDSSENYFSTWIAYCLAGYAALAVMSIFKVRRAPAVFLAGAVFGWLVEGVIVGTAYESLPFSVSFTGLAWHAALSVGIGLWLIPTVLSRRGLLIVPVSICTGLFFGAWGINWNANAAEYHASAPEFILFALATTALLIPAYGIFTASRRSPIRIHPVEAIPLGLLAAFFFVFRAVEQPAALCILPILMGATLFGLWRNRQREMEESLLKQPLAPVTGGSLAALLLIPVSAAAVYAPAAWLGWRIPTNILFYILLMPMGFVLYFASLVGIYTDRRGSIDGCGPIDRRGL